MKKLILLLPMLLSEPRKINNGKTNNTFLMLLLISTPNDGTMKFLPKRNLLMENDPKQRLKNVGELAKSLYGTTSKEKQPEVPTIPLSWITTLFQRFQGIWLNKWAACIPSIEILESAKLDWHQALGGYTADEIRKGIEAARTLEWPPSIGEFLRLCRADTVAAHQDATPLLEHMRSWKGNCSPEARAEWEKVRAKL